jgi:hypothetical protein
LGFFAAGVFGAAALLAGLFITVFAFQGEMSRITMKQIHLRMHVWARL